MKSLLTLIAYPIAALTASIPREAQAVPSGPFALGAWKLPHGLEPVFLGTSINASGGKFYINKATSTYCPTVVEGLDCSLYAGTGTTLATDSGSTTMSMEVNVPGGQLGKRSTRFR